MESNGIDKFNLEKEYKILYFNLIEEHYWDAARLVLNKLLIMEQLKKSYEFKVNCNCGNKVRCTDGIKEYTYICGKCEKVYSGTKPEIFT